MNIKIVWAALISLIIISPYLIWEIRNNWPTLEFMRNAELYKNVSMGVFQYFKGQIAENNPMNAVIWITGLAALFSAQYFKRYWALGIAFIILFAVFAFAHGKVYYLAPYYILLFAAGSVTFEKFVIMKNWKWLAYFVISLLVMSGVVFAPIVIPILPVETLTNYTSYLGIKPAQSENTTLGQLPQHFADRFGWKHLAEKVARTYFSLDSLDKKDCVIYATNYGEAAAINYYGRKMGLPSAVSQHNSFYFWGPGNGSGKLILMARSNLDDVQNIFESVTIADTVQNRYAMPYESKLMILICRNLKIPLEQAWIQGKLFI